MKDKYTTNLLKIITLSLLTIFPFSGTGICAEKINKESVKQLLTQETFVLINLSNDRTCKKHFRKDGTWVEFTNNGLSNDFGSWRVNDLGQLCQNSDFRLGKENCSYIYKEGDNYLTYHEKNSGDGEKIINEVIAWQIDSNYTDKNINNANRSDIANIKKKALEATPAAGETDSGMPFFQTLKRSIANFFD